MRLLFGCSHKKTSFPMTLRKGSAGSRPSPRTYIVCLDCGREFLYSWEEMRVVRKERGEAIQINASRSTAGGVSV